MQADGSVEIDLGPVSEGDDDRSVEDLRDELLDEVDSEGVEDEYNLPDFDNDHPLPPYIIEDMHSRNEYQEGGPLPPHIVEMPGLDSDEDEIRRDDSEDEENLPALEMPGLISDSDSEEEQGIWVNDDLEFIPINANLDRLHFPVFRNLLGTWEFNEGQVVTYVRRTERSPTYTSYRSLADEELLQEVHDRSGCSYCGVRNCSVPVHQAARHSKDQMLDREVNWRQKTVSGEVCGDVIHCIADCAMFGDKYVFNNGTPVGAVIHSEHCIQADKERLQQVWWLLRKALSSCHLTTQ